MAYSPINILEYNKEEYANMPLEEEEGDNTIVAPINEPIRGEGVEVVGDGGVEAEGENHPKE